MDIVTSKLGNNGTVPVIFFEIVFRNRNRLFCSPSLAKNPSERRRVRTVAVAPSAHFRPFRPLHRQPTSFLAYLGVCTPLTGLILCPRASHPLSSSCIPPRTHPPAPTTILLRDLGFHSTTAIHRASHRDYHVLQTHYRAATLTLSPSWPSFLPCGSGPSDHDRHLPSLAIPTPIYPQPPSPGRPS